MTTANRESKITRKEIREFFESERGLRKALLKYSVFLRTELIEAWENYLRLGIDENFSELSYEECEEFLYAIKAYCNGFFKEFPLLNCTGEGVTAYGSRAMEFYIDPAEPERWGYVMKCIYDPDIHGRSSQEE